MKTSLILGILAIAVLPVHADLVDPGILHIGGEGIFGGTVTIQGSGAQGYSLTTSSGIHIRGGRLKLDSGSVIEWPDGKTSATASGGGPDASNLMLPLAWANFDGTGSGSGAQTILADVNVAGVTRISAGLFEVKFSTPPANADYACQCAATSTSGPLRLCLLHNGSKSPITTTGVFLRIVGNDWNAYPADRVTVTCFGQPTTAIIP